MAMCCCIKCQHDDAGGVAIESMHDANARKLLAGTCDEAIGLLGPNTRDREQSCGFIKHDDVIVAVQYRGQSRRWSWCVRVVGHVWSVS